MGLFRTRRPGPDPYERAVLEGGEEPLEPFEPLPPLPHQLSAKRLLVYFGIVVIAVTLVRSGNDPVVQGSCTSPAFVLGSSEVRTLGVMRWSAAGPASGSVVIGLDTTTLPATPADGRLAGPVTLADCTASGVFAMRAPEGEHRVTAFLVAADGSTRVLSTTTVQVTAR